MGNDGLNSHFLFAQTLSFSCTLSFPWTLFRRRQVRVYGEESESGLVWLVGNAAGLEQGPGTAGRLLQAAVSLLCSGIGEQRAHATAPRVKTPHVERRND